MLLTVVEKYLRETGIRPARFGRAALGDPSFVFELRRGREPRPRTVQKVLAYLDTHSAPRGQDRKAGGSDARV